MKKLSVIDNLTFCVDIETYPSLQQYATNNIEQHALKGPQEKTTRSLWRFIHNMQVFV